MSRSITTSILAVICVLGVRCISDDRCGPGMTQESARCVPIAEAGPDKAIEDDGAIVEAGTDKAVEDAAPRDMESTDTDGAGGCAFTPTAEQLVGSFKQLGKVSDGTCTPPLPAAGDDFDAEITLSLDNETIKATVVNVFVTLEGTATIGSDGKVTVSAVGDTLGIEVSAQLTYCFSDADNATSEVSVSLKNPSPLCEFNAPGTLERE